MKKNNLPSLFTDGNRTNRNTQSRADLDGAPQLTWRT